MRIVRIIVGYMLAATLFVLAIPAAVIALGRATDAVAGWRLETLWPINIVVAGVLGAFGLFWVAWSWWFLLTRGRGHPAEGFGIEFHPVTRQIVTNGPYARTRNPMMLGYLFVMLAIAAFYGSIGMVVAVVVIAAIGWVNIVFFEERRLEQRFGQAYAQYKQGVPRFWPGRRRDIGRG